MSSNWPPAGPGRAPLRERGSNGSRELGVITSQALSDAVRTDPKIQAKRRHFPEPRSRKVLPMRIPLAIAPPRHSAACEGRRDCDGSSRRRDACGASAEPQGRLLSPWRHSRESTPARRGRRWADPKRNQRGHRNAGTPHPDPSRESRTLRHPEAPMSIWPASARSLSHRGELAGKRPKILMQRTTMERG